MVVGLSLMRLLVAGCQLTPDTMASCGRRFPVGLFCQNLPVPDYRSSPRGTSGGTLLPLGQPNTGVGLVMRVGGR